MRVHFRTQSGDKETIDCESVWEGDNGLYLMNRPEEKLKHAIGYVPFEKLDYVEPTLHQ